MGWPCREGTGLDAALKQEWSRLPEPGAFRVSPHLRRDPQEFFVECSTKLVGDDVMGEATREAPVRTEPHPTSGGALPDQRLIVVSS